MECRYRQIVLINIISERSYTWCTNEIDQTGEYKLLHAYFSKRNEPEIRRTAVQMEIKDRVKALRSNTLLRGPCSRRKTNN